MEKKLEKIQSVHLGLNEGQLGLQFTLGDGSWGVCTQWKGAWYKRSEHAKWTIEDQKRVLGEAFLHLGDILSTAKKSKAEDLVNVPIEATFEGMILKEWRVLTEVL